MTGGGGSLIHVTVTLCFYPPSAIIYTTTCVRACVCVHIQILITHYNKLSLVINEMLRHSPHS